LANRLPLPHERTQAFHIIVSEKEFSREECGNTIKTDSKKDFGKVFHRRKPFKRRVATAELLGAYGFRGNLILIVCRFCFDRFPSRASEIAPAPNTNPSVSRFNTND
jgi:hypothetical protein